MLSILEKSNNQLRWYTEAAYLVAFSFDPSRGQWFLSGHLENTKVVAAAFRVKVKSTSQMGPTMSPLHEKVTLFNVTSADRLKSLVVRVHLS